MNLQFRDRQQQALVEVEITLHPAALRAALFGRGGLPGRLLRLGAMLVLLFLALGWQLRLPQYFPELHFAPLPLAIAWVTCRCGILYGLAAALPSALAAAAWSAMPAAPVILSAGLAALLTDWLRFFCPPLRPAGWLPAALTGSAAVAAHNLALMPLAFSLPWRELAILFAGELLLAPLLNGIILAPLLFALMDAVTQTRPVFVSARQPSPPPTTEATGSIHE